MERRWRDGWMWLIVSATSRCYLTLLLALAVCALIPSFFGLTGSVVQSGSMEPRISPGDVVLSKAFPADAPAPLGHVISFPAPPGSAKPGMMLHRLVGVNDDGTFITRGDANADADSTGLARENIVSQAGLLIPWIGLPSFWLGHGNLLTLAAWLVVTTAALVMVGVDREDQAKDQSARTREPVRKTNRRLRRGARAAAKPAAVLALIAVVGLSVTPAQPSQAAFTALASTGGSGWGAAAKFPAADHPSDAYTAIASSITNTSATRITGNVAVAPGTMTGFPAGQVTGTVNLNNSAASNAAADATALRKGYAARTPTKTVAPTLSGTLLPGTYASTTGAFAVPGDLTLDARGDPNAVFVLNATGTLTVAGSIVLAGGAQAKNVIWTSSTASLSVGVFRGTLLTASDASVTRGASVAGRLLIGGTLTLDKVDVTP